MNSDNARSIRVIGEIRGEIHGQLLPYSQWVQGQISRQFTLENEIITQSFNINSII